MVEGVCVLYYKFILSITRGAPNKAVKKESFFFSFTRESTFCGKFCQFSETHRILKIGRPMFIFFLRYNTTQDYLLKPWSLLDSPGQG